jgi:hypothetical protein
MLFGMPKLAPASVRITKMGGTLYIRVPPEFVHANNLKPGDMLVPDFSTFKIIRQKAVDAPCEEPEAITA